MLHNDFHRVFVPAGMHDAKITQIKPQRECLEPVEILVTLRASDLIKDGREGFVVPICSAEAIAERLNALNEDRELLARMSQNAHRTAAGRPWGEYRAAWAEALKVALWQ